MTKTGREELLRKVEEIVRRIARAGYWDGENTGDYDNEHTDVSEQMEDVLDLIEREKAQARAEGATELAKRVLAEINSRKYSPSDRLILVRTMLTQYQEGREE